MPCSKRQDAPFSLRTAAGRQLSTPPCTGAAPSQHFKKPPQTGATTAPYGEAFGSLGRKAGGKENSPGSREAQPLPALLPFPANDTVTAVSSNSR